LVPVPEQVSIVIGADPTPRRFLFCRRRCPILADGYAPDGYAPFLHSQIYALCMMVILTCMMVILTKEWLPPQRRKPRNGFGAFQGGRL